MQNPQQIYWAQKSCPMVQHNVFMDALFYWTEIAIFVNYFQDINLIAIIWYKDR